MMFYKSIILLLLALPITLLSGCWNYRDIEQYSIVAGMAIDKNEQGDKYLLTAEVIDFEMTGKETKGTSKFVESEGNTLLDAIRSMINITGKRLYWAHADVVVISRDLAEEGVAPLIDLIGRDQEIREEMYVVISKNKAKDLLKAEVAVEGMHSFNIDNMLKHQKSITVSPEVMVYELHNILISEGISPALPAFGIVSNSGKKTLELIGVAVFKSDKLVGFLDREESKYFCFASDKVDKGVLTEKMSPENQMSDITLEVFKSKTEVKPTYSNGKLAMDIKIRTVASIAEIGTSINYISKKWREQLKKKAEESMKTSVEKLIKKVQNEYNSDIFGFGRIVKANMPSLWKQIGQDWDNLFKTLEVNVNVDITIKGSGVNSKTIELGG